MTADVNVTEKVARALADNGSWPGVVTSTDLDGAFAALRVLRDPDVLAGIADRLDQHIPCEDSCGLCICAPDTAWTPHHQAAELVDWLTGGAS